MHELVNDGEYAKLGMGLFHLLYNGKVITNRIHQCHDDMELCDINILLTIVNEFATRDDVNCSRQHPIRHQETLSTQTEQLESSIILKVLFTKLIIVAFWIRLSHNWFQFDFFSSSFCLSTPKMELFTIRNYKKQKNSTIINNYYAIAYES
jgi:hypothetical protein